MRTIRIKRWLYLLHRWLGIGSCLLILMWFLSGIVMMYVGYPKLTEDERLQHLPALDTGAGLLPPHQALLGANVQGPLQELRLSATSGGVPVYQAWLAPEAQAGATQAQARSRSARVLIDARTGQRLPTANSAHAQASALAYAGPRASVQHLGLVDEDANTHSRGLDGHRPLHRIAVDDEAGTWLYVSSQTGEVVRDASRRERLWNIAGAWMHWLYPFRGNVFDAHWATIVNTLSLLAIAAALSGTVIGLMRWRFTRRYRHGARTPYHSATMRWHHVVGLLFAFSTLTWLFSGLMSMNPWRLFDARGPALHLEAMHGPALLFTPQDAAPQVLLSAAARARARARTRTGGEATDTPAVASVRELRWTRSLGEPVVQVHSASTQGEQPLLLHSESALPHAVNPAVLRRAVIRLIQAPVWRVDTLQAHDLYYYTRAPHTMTGGRDKPLPIWRVIFADKGHSWVHIDPHTGQVLDRMDQTQRRKRWLFAMLHSWDWLPLLERRPLWDVVLLMLSVGGALLSATGVVIGWRRLRRPRLRRRPAP